MLAAGSQMSIIHHKKEPRINIEMAPEILFPSWQEQQVQDNREACSQQIFVNETLVRIDGRDYRLWI